MGLVSMLGCDQRSYVRRGSFSTHCFVNERTTWRGSETHHGHRARKEAASKRGQISNSLNVMLRDLDFNPACCKELNILIAMVKPESGSQLEDY